MAELDTPTISMDANLLEPNERDYELAVRNIIDIPFIYTRAGYLNARLNEERSQNVDPMQYPLVGDVEQEQYNITRNVTTLAAWALNNLTAYWWNNASIREVQTIHTRLVHWHMRILRVNQRTNRRARELETQCQQAICLAATILARHVAPEVSIDLTRADNHRNGDLRMQQIDPRQYDNNLYTFRAERPPSVLSGYSTATKTGITAEEVESIHHSTQYGVNARHFVPPRHSPIRVNDNTRIFQPINPMGRTSLNT